MRIEEGNKLGYNRMNNPRQRHFALPDLMKGIGQVKKRFCVAVFVLIVMAAPGLCGEKDALVASVAALNIQRQGYTLCEKLTPAQQAHARENMEASNSRKVYRFRDKGLNIVADHETHRVVVMFEPFEKIGQAEIRNLVGDLVSAYGDPTVSVRDRMIVWAWGEEGKFTAAQFQEAREKKIPLGIIATVKLNSEVNILGDSEGQPRGNAYYIVSSDPLLPFFKDEESGGADDS